ncbi:hypothetical protein GCM10011361_20460 [Muriicola marianensis]|uniref:Gliding motility-associated protein GldM N-terminal domain-containing protein n=1 Tax=Muriicola marianensis TaxID=1324801 RepID=A0ABQ1R3U5_9FLAO|nr:hypothetical protein GCM10011361_20460 [Muriicola marianensis]
MFGFFRKLRYDLINEHKIARYLKYAIGEIILVVIGILIALQINNWNESRKQEEIKIRYLQELRSEFSQNLVLIDNSIRTYEDLKATSSKILGYTGEKSMHISEKELALLLNRSFAANARFIPSPSIIQDLVNSGILTDLKTDTLRLQLAEWPAKLEGAKRKEEEIIEQRNAIVEILLIKIPFLDALQLDGSGNLYEPLSRGSHFQGDTRDILNDIQFENRLGFFIVSLIGSDIFYKNIRAHCEAILESIEKELEVEQN